MKQQTEHILAYREMTIEHYEKACRLWEQTEGVGITTGDSREQLQHYLERNPAMSFVCIDKRTDVLVGTILCGHEGRRGFIYHLAVQSDYRGKSIATTLVEHGLAKLKEAGITRCLIMVKADNETGKEFWSKTGWTKRDDLCMYSRNL